MYTSTLCSSRVQGGGFGSTRKVKHRKTLNVCGGDAWICLEEMTTPSKSHSHEPRLWGPCQQSRAGSWGLVFKHSGLMSLTGCSTTLAQEFGKDEVYDHRTLRPPTSAPENKSPQADGSQSIQSKVLLAEGEVQHSVGICRSTIQRCAKLNPICGFLGLQGFLHKKIQAQAFANLCM